MLAPAAALGVRPRRASRGWRCCRGPHAPLAAPKSAQPEDADAVALRAALAAEYAQAAEEYDTKWAAYTEATVRATLAHLPPLPPNAVVLDLACGTGALMRGLVASGASVGSYVGLDNSAGMLAAAERAAVASPPPFAARWALGAADATLPVADASCDLVMCASSFHFFGDKAPCLAEVDRVLRPGGTLLLSDWSRDVWTCVALEWWLRLRGSPTARVLSSAELRGLVDAQPGLRTQDVAVSTLLLFWGFMVLTARKA